MRAFWSKTSAPLRIGAVVDVGEGKIEVALVSSSADKPEPNIVWTHIEIIPGSMQSNPEAYFEKAIHNSFSAISKNGLRALRQLRLPEHISLIQASLHAPSAITVARNVSIKDTKPFKVTRALVKELEAKAMSDADKLQSSTLVKSGLKLFPLSSSLTALRLNGYETKYPWRNTCTEVSLSQHVNLATIDFFRILNEARDKYLPKTPVDADSFVSLFFRAVASLAPKAANISLISIGDGSTEFMTVRDGLPQDTHYMPMGLNHLAAIISSQTGLLSHEARNLTKDNAVEEQQAKSPAGRQVVAEAMRSYEEELKKLLSKNGDSLALPKMIYLQAECDHERFFSDMVKRIAGGVTGTAHEVTAVTSQFFECGDVRDASLLSLAYVFHKKLYEDRYLSHE